VSKYICERCGLREATVTSEAGRFCPDCDELNDREQQDASLQEENAQLRTLVQGYYTLLRVIHPGFWKDTMGPYWLKQKDRLQEQAKPFVRKHDE
jgi:hypothetical protein